MRVIDHKKTRVSRQKRVSALSVLGEVHCEQVSYDFEIPLSSFNVKAFSKTTGIKPNQNWSAGIYPRDEAVGYHAHFNGRITSKYVSMTIEYWDGAHKSPPSDVEPFAESIMQWVGSFMLDPIPARAMVFARFEKPIETWRSRFNLPFKVTMADAEVVIDGVSIILPKNQFRALTAFVTLLDGALGASVQLVRSVDFMKFSIEDEIAAFNESTKMFLEPII